MSVRRAYRHWMTLSATSAAVVVLSGCFATYGRGYRTGVRVDHVPRGSIVFEYRGHPHYYHDGRFYRRHDRGYQVIVAPRGAVLPRLPRGGRTYRRHGVEYKEYRGIRYERVERGGDRGYRVRGKVRGGRGRGHR